MSDSTVAVKLVVVLAIVVLLANQMGVGTNPFQALQDTLSTAPGTPVFEDPFALREYIAWDTVPVANNPTLPHPLPHQVINCDLDAYYQCVESADGDASYMRFTGFGAYVRIRVPPDVPADIGISRITVEIQARTTYENTTLAVVTNYNNIHLFVPRNQGWVNITESVLPDVDFSWPEGEDVIAFAISGLGGVDLSYIHLIFYAGGHVPCTADPGAWFPWIDEVACAIGEAVDWFLTALQFIANAIIFAFTLIVQWAVWFGQVIVGFVQGLVNLALWFLEVDAPVIIQAIFGIVTVAIIGFISLLFAGLVKGII